MPRKKSKSLTRNSKIILADLFMAKRPLSVRKIAERNKIAWKTASDNLKKLERRGLVTCKSKLAKGGGRRGKRACSLNPQIRKQLRR